MTANRFGKNWETNENMQQLNAKTRGNLFIWDTYKRKSSIKMQIKRK